LAELRPPKWGWRYGHSVRIRGRSGMSSSRRATPFALLVLLAMGSALGIGLGLAEAPTSGRSVPSGTAIPSAKPTGTRTPAASPTSSVPISAGAPPCTSQSLQLTSSALDTNVPEKLTQGALTLLNASSAPCEFSTTPMVEVLGSTGTVLASSMSSKAVNDLIRPGQAQAANVSWENWCGANVRPFSLSVVLPNGGGTLSIPYGNAETQLPTCIDPSQPSQLIVHGSGGPGTLFPD